MKLDLVSRLECLWGGCQRCPLHKERRNIVHWRGNLDSPLLLIGEAPGADEDLAGRPFVGRAGRLLDELLSEASLDPSEDVVVTNTVACRPPGNRKPHGDELKACRRRLGAFIRIVRPKVIVLLGAVAAKLAGVHSISSHRGSTCEVEVGSLITDAVPTYHPSFLLRTNSAEHRACVIQDFELAVRLAGQ